MRLLSWNVKFNTLPKNLHLVVKAIGAVKPDLVTLQEVKSELADEMAKCLAGLGLKHSLNSGKDAPDNPKWLIKYKKKYQCLIASKWPLSPVDDTWRKGAPYPEILGRAMIELPEGDVELFTVHIPNGSGNGWSKIDTFNVLLAALREGNDSPRILTGDFNEPREFRSSGQVVTWGENIDKNGVPYLCKEWADGYGRRGSGKEWDDPVRSVLAGASRHGLRDAYRALHGFARTPVTHVTKGSPKCYDHTFVSRHFDLKACGYCHKYRKSGVSDHSPMWTELELNADLPPLVLWDGYKGDLKPDFDPDLERFFQYPSLGIVFDSEGRIKAPKDPVLQKRALQLMLAWQMHSS